MKKIEEYAYRITKKMSFPRMSGTSGADEAVSIIENEFRKIGFSKIYKEKFITSIRNWVLYKYIYILISVLLVAFPVSFTINSIASFMVLSISIIFAAIFHKVTNSAQEIPKSSKYNVPSENLFVTIPNKKAKKKIVVLAHYDTKSQTFPSYYKIYTITIPIVGLLIFTLAYIPVNIFHYVLNYNLEFINQIFQYLSYIIVPVALSNIFNKTGNNSPGATDNAAGVGVLLALASLYKKKKLKNSEIYFLSTGSEELNLYGAEIFMRNNKSVLDVENTYFINIDGIGSDEALRYVASYGIPARTSSQKLNTLIQQTSVEKEISTKELYMPFGTWSDFIPVISHGYEACWIACDGIIKYIHTPEDTIDLVTLEGLKNCIDLCTGVIEKLDKD